MSNNFIQSSAATSFPSSPTRVIPVVSPEGIEAWSVRSDFVPLIALSFTIEGGSSQDPAGKEGLMQLMSRLLDEGAGPYDSDAFQKEMAARAIELSFSVSQDGFSGSLKTLLIHVDKAFELLRLALLEPKFDEAAIERVRAQTPASLRYQQNDPGVMATRAFFEAGFPGHPYGSTGAGTLESVAALTRQDIVDIHARVISRVQLKVAVVGAFDEAYIGGCLIALLPTSRQPTSSTPYRRWLLPTVVSVSSKVSMCRNRSYVLAATVFRGVTRISPLPMYSTISSVVVLLPRACSRKFARSVVWPIVLERRPVSYRQASMTWGYTATKNERVAERVFGDGSLLVVMAGRPESLEA